MAWSLPSLREQRLERLADELVGLDTRRWLTPHELERLESEGFPVPPFRCRWVADGETFDAGDRTLAAFLRIPRHVLLYRMEKYGIQKP